GRALSREARALRPRSSRLLRERPPQSLLRLAAVREEHDRGAIRPEDPQRRATDRRQLHGQLSVHDRSAALENHRPLPRAEPAPHRFGGVDQDRLHGVSDRPDDELSAQRTASGGAVSRVLALMHRHLVPPESVEEGTDLTAVPWRTEYDVVSTLSAMGHEVQSLAVHDDLGEIRRRRTEWEPPIAVH